MKNLVICAMPRSGSTMIADTLARHPAIMGLTEVFHHLPEIRKKCHGRVIKDEGIFAIEELETYTRLDLYLDLLESIAAYRGKSVLSYKLMESQAPGIYSELSRRDSILIYLRRENLVAAVASWKLAELTGVRHAGTTEVRDKAPLERVQVSREEVEAWAAREAIHGEQVKRTRIPFLPLTYGGIAWNPAEAMKQIFDWIEIAPCSVAIAQVKLNTRSLPEIVENLDELREAFKGTRFEWMTRDETGAK